MLAAARSLQSWPTLCDPKDGSLPGSPVPGILQARTLEWVAISFSDAWKWKSKVKSLSHVRLLVTPWTAAHQALPSMGFFRQEYWSGVPSPSPLGRGWAIPNLSLSSWGWDFCFFTQKILGFSKKWSPLFWMKHFSVTNVFRVTDSRILVFSFSSQDDGWLLILHLCN